MSNIEYCIKKLRRMYKNRNYKSEDDRFNTIYQEILEYSNQERDDLEMFFKCEKAAYERTMRLLGIIPLIISILAMLSSICNATLKPENDPEAVSIVFGVIAVFAIIVFIWIYTMCDRNTVKVTYLLHILDIAKNDSKKRN